MEADARFQSPIHGSPTTEQQYQATLWLQFQSPIHGSPTGADKGSNKARGGVSIPYTRVTNDAGDLTNANIVMCFNPLYTGHQRCCRVIKYGLLGQVSIPYTRVTNEDSAVKAVIKKSVSIPYTRVTNMDYEKAMII